MRDYFTVTDWPWVRAMRSEGKPNSCQESNAIKIPSVSTTIEIRVFSTGHQLEPIAIYKVLSAQVNGLVGFPFSTTSEQWSFPLVTPLRRHAVRPVASGERIPGHCLKFFRNDVISGLNKKPKDIRSFPRAEKRLPHHAPTAILQPDGGGDDILIAV